MDNTILAGQELPKHFLALRNLQREKIPSAPRSQAFDDWLPPRLCYGKNDQSESDDGDETRTLEDLLSRPELLQPLLAEPENTDQERKFKAPQYGKNTCAGDYWKDWHYYRLQAIGVCGTGPFQVSLPFATGKYENLDTLPGCLLLYVFKNLDRDGSEYEFHIIRHKASALPLPCCVPVPNAVAKQAPSGPGDRAGRNDIHLQEVPFVAPAGASETEAG
jgi:hypothetical protein